MEATFKTTIIKVFFQMIKKHMVYILSKRNTFESIKEYLIDLRRVV